MRTYLSLFTGSLLRRGAMRQPKPLPRTDPVVLEGIGRGAWVCEVNGDPDLCFHPRFGSTFGNAWKHDGEAIRGSVSKAHGAYVGGRRRTCSTSLSVDRLPFDSMLKDHASGGAMREGVSV